MPNGRKPIKITLFHADWCGHCTNFKPTWEEMIVDEKACKNIDFEDHEESTIGALDESIRTVNGQDVRSFGYPMIKVTINEDEYVYQGRRTPEEIYGFILEELASTNGNRDVVVTKGDKEIRISTSEKDVLDSISEFESSGMKGGDRKKKTKVAPRRLTKNDFKFLSENVSFSDAYKIK